MRAAKYSLQFAYNLHKRMEVSFFSGKTLLKLHNRVNNSHRTQKRLACRQPTALVFFGFLLLSRLVA